MSTHTYLRKIKKADRFDDEPANHHLLTTYDPSLLDADDCYNLIGQSRHEHGHSPTAAEFTASDQLTVTVETVDVLGVPITAYRIEGVS